MKITEVQKNIEDYFKRGNFKIWSKFAILARLEEEISEIGRLISVEEGLREKWKVKKMNYVDEFGDALFQLIHLANQCNVNIEEALNNVFKKYEKYIKNEKKQK
jgi:NTP pyrophosphatase (non-canonical NTP hydrolase)